MGWQRCHTPRGVQHHTERPASSASFYYTLPTPPTTHDSRTTAESRPLSSRHLLPPALPPATEQGRAPHLDSAGVIFITSPVAPAPETASRQSYHTLDHPSSHTKHPSLPAWPLTPPAQSDYQLTDISMSSDGGAGSSGDQGTTPSARMETDPLFPPPPVGARRRSRTAGESGPVRGIVGQAAEEQAAVDRGSATAAAAGAGGASSSRPAVAALAAAVGPKTTEKSCRNCRTRKVKCDRKWPRCQRCKDRKEECDFGSFVPVDAIPVAALQGAMTARSPSDGGDRENVFALQARIANLEAELEALRAPPAASGSNLARQPDPRVRKGSAASGSNEQMGSGSNSSASGPSRRQSVPVVPYPHVAGAQDFSSRVPHPGSPGSLVTLTESLSAAFELGAGLREPGPEGEQRGRTVEVYLRGVAMHNPELYSLAAKGLGPIPDRNRAGGIGRADQGLPTISEEQPEWRLARAWMARTLVVHLILFFYNSCCAYLPAFSSWHDRRDWLINNVDNLDPASRVVATAFCAMGARASPHSAILGISLPSPSPTDCFEEASIAGHRREAACRALHNHAFDLMHSLGILYDFSRENLEALLVLIQMLIFNELMPQRSRSLMLFALGQYKELQDSALPPGFKEETRKEIGLPLLENDSVTAAYARKKPLISASDLEHYFPAYLHPDTNKDNMQSIVQDCLRDTLASDGRLTHEGVSDAANIVQAWISHSHRLFAQVAAPQPGGPPSTLVDDIRKLWTMLDQIHEGIRKVQEMLVQLSYVPQGCQGDGCTDEHLRFITRLDKDLLDTLFLIHSLVTENLGLDSLIGDTAQATYVESDKRVRKALKLIAFYLELYLTSRDPHLTYHVIFSLEILPNWTAIAVQRFGETDGPLSPDLELTDEELDWIDKGLVVGSYYHPIANGRLQELKQSRRPSYRAQPHASTAAAVQPPFTAALPTAAAKPTPLVGGGAGGTGAGAGGEREVPPPPSTSSASASGSVSYSGGRDAGGGAGYEHYAPPGAAAGGGAERFDPAAVLVPRASHPHPHPHQPHPHPQAHGFGYQFQGGVTDPQASKKWGEWGG
uniref:BY PROTMAP: gi/472585190/gb/EMS22756.1/ C6 transcription factor [Rhodosporidium toruloides NP11] gi/647400044/emb/CDR45149.1/ RHTO0S10e05534g1_1 [Rhodosporidium toruloides] n=1 Tax=Rhodotorula toruloides TaxID=5286 RepID=A0A0K3CFP7_RHOTO